MAVIRKTKQKAEFGDFQTPIDLARKVCLLLSQRGLEPLSVLEPTCGLGNFLVAALESFPTLRTAIGIEINEHHVNEARSVLKAMDNMDWAEVRQEDFFKIDWEQVLMALPDPLLVIGNPPWVTNSQLGSLGSSNLPQKSNFQSRRGIDAITGQGNFDISEWMLIRSLEWIRGRPATLAVLCKTTVARKVLLHAWQTGQRLERSDIYRIEAMKYFGAAVEACLLVVQSSLSSRNLDCEIHDSFDDRDPVSVFGYRNGHLVADVKAFERWKNLEGKEWYKWRSGIKHDCADVMEFHEHKGLYMNNMGEAVDLESKYLYPMLKSADIANGSDVQPKRWMLVTQRFVGEETSAIREMAPKTWAYLESHGNRLDRRSSSIYRKRPRFSVFGVGDYSFAPWKVAISGFYKKLDFKVVGPFKQRPVMLDDTCYFIPCSTKDEAELIARLLNSAPAREFFSALIFWDAKRPITVTVLRRLDLLASARDLELESRLQNYLKGRNLSSADPSQPALSLI